MSDKHIASGCRPEGGWHLYRDPDRTFGWLLSTYGRLSTEQLFELERQLGRARQSEADETPTR